MKAVNLINFQCAVSEDISIVGYHLKMSRATMHHVMLSALQETKSFYNF